MRSKKQIGWPEPGLKIGSGISFGFLGTWWPKDEGVEQDVQEAEDLEL